MIDNLGKDTKKTLLLQRALTKFVVSCFVLTCDF